MLLITVRKAAHPRHDAEYIVVSGVDAHFGGLCASDGRGGNDKLKGSVVDTAEIAGAAWLVFLRAKGERVDVDAGVRVAGVVLVRLDKVEVRSFALAEAVLAVKLKFACYNRVLSPAVHVQGSLGKNEHASVGETVGDGAGNGSANRAVGRGHGAGKILRDIEWQGVVEETRSIDHSGGAALLVGRSVGQDRVGECINSVGVVEWLCAEGLVHEAALQEGVAVSDVGVRLNDENQLFARVVEIELDLVARGSDGFIAGELELLDEVLVWVLGHAATLVGVKEHVIDVERSGNERFGVGVGDLHRSGSGGGGYTSDSEKALVERADFDVNLNFVVLKGNQRKSKARVAAEPELEWDVKGGLRKSLARGADSLWDVGGTASSGDLGETWVAKVRELRGLANHFVVSRLLFRSQSELVPDVHPVTILAVDALASDFDFNHRNHLLTGVVKPASEHLSGAGRISLVHLRECHLKVCAVGKVAISGDGALHTAAEIGLAVESLFNRFHSEIGVSAVGNLPECDLWVSRKIDVLCAVSN